MSAERLYRFGPFRLDAAGHILFRDGKTVQMAPKVADTLFGDFNNAFRYLRKACEEREIWAAFLKIDPRLDTLRDDRRFFDLLRMVNLSD